MRGEQMPANEKTHRETGGFDELSGGARSQARRRQSSRRLDVPDLGEVEHGVLLLGPTLFAFEALNTLGAAQDVTVLGKATLADKRTVNAHGKPFDECDKYDKWIKDKSSRDRCLAWLRALAVLGIGFGLWLGCSANGRWPVSLLDAALDADLEVRLLPIDQPGGG